jgi:hypothetical protein
MAVQNLQPGAIKNVLVNEIRRRVHVYRTGQGYDGPGDVGWLPNGGQLQQQPLAIGHTVSFNINGAAGMLANGCPSMVQLLWEDAVAVPASNVTENAARTFLERNQSAATRFRSTSRSAVGDTPGQLAMQNLTAQWYNTVTTGLGLDPSTFQLFQGNAPIGSTSESLWNIFDVVPPAAVNNFYNPSQANVFSTDYGAVINNLKPQNASAFQNIMGDYYSQWVAYLKSTPPPTIPSGGIIALFNNWSQMNMPPGQAQQAYTAYQQIAQGVVPVAVQMWLNAGGSASGVKAYNNTITALQNALLSAPPKTVQMNSATASTDLSHTWAGGNIGGAFDFFSGEGSTSYDQLTTALSKAGIQVNASFDHVVTFTAAPLSKTSTDPILSQYQPWYSSAALNLAYQNNNNVVWNNTPPTWQDTFGPNGNMLRTASSLVIVDGINITMSSNVAFSSSQQTQFTAAAKAGFWPFFEASAQGGWNNATSFDANGNVTVTSSCPTGNPNILGVLVTPIGGALML